MSLPLTKYVINDEIRPWKHMKTAKTCVIANKIVINRSLGQSLDSVCDRITVFSNDCVIKVQMGTWEREKSPRTSEVAVEIVINPAT